MVFNYNLLRQSEKTSLTTQSLQLRTRGKWEGKGRSKEVKNWKMMGSHSKQRSGRSIGDPAARWFASSAPAGAAETRARAVNCFQADWRPPYRKHEFSTRPICIRSLRCLLLQTVGQTLAFVGKMATQLFLPMLSPSSENFRFFDRTNWFNFF